MNWIKFAHRLPPDDETEIFIRKIDASEWHQCPANECWLDVPHESKNEWEWAFWKTIKLKAKHVGGMVLIRQLPMDSINYLVKDSDD